MEDEGEFGNWDWNAYYDLLPPEEEAAGADGPPLPPLPLSSDGQCPAATPQLMIAADGSWALDVEVLSTLDIIPNAEAEEDWRLFGHDWIHGLPDHQAGYESQDHQLSSSGGDVDSSSGTADATMYQAQPDPFWGMDWLPPMAPNASVCLEVGPHDSPPATGPNHPEPASEEMLRMMMTLADMVRMAQECGNHEAERRVWSQEEHNELLKRIQGYAELDVDERARRCVDIAFYLPKKTAIDVALRWRWLQDKEKTAAKQAEVVDKASAGQLVDKASAGQLVEKGSAGVKLNKDKEKTAAKQAEVVVVDKGFAGEVMEKGSAGVEVKKRQGTKGAKKNKNNYMYPLSKEALDSKITTRELLRDSSIFMQRIEENIKAGKWGDNTADYFYYVKTIMDALEKRPNEFCGISMPMPPIDEQGVEEIVMESRHSSSASKEALILHDGAGR